MYYERLIITRKNAVSGVFSCIIFSLVSLSLLRR